MGNIRFTQLVESCGNLATEVLLEEPSKKQALRRICIITNKPLSNSSIQTLHLKLPAAKVLTRCNGKVMK